MKLKKKAARPNRKPKATGKRTEIHTTSERRFAQLFAKLINGELKGPVKIQLD